MRKKTIVSWSTGKDSALLLYRLLRSEDIEVVGLLTTLREKDQKINIHETDAKDLEWQAKRLNLPLHRVFLPDPCPNSIYLARVFETLNVLKAQGLTHLAFGDLFLEDIRKFREKNFGDTFSLLFPLWGEKTDVIAREIIKVGIQAKIVAVDSERLPQSLIGQPFDLKFLENLPNTVDPCGENGEFHTFVHNSPDMQ